MSTNCELKCDWASFEAVKYACEHWHYSKCVPCGKIFKIGAWEDGVYIGCVLFSRGANNHLGEKYGLAQIECVELTRIALREHKHFVSEIMMQAVKKLHEFCPGIRMIISYADPEQGHVGAIYQATNWIYVGRIAPNVKFVVDGKSIHKRSIDSIKPKNMTANEFFMHKYKNGKIVLDKGKYKYLMPLDKKMRKLVLPLAKPYPKKEQHNAASCNKDS